MKNKKDIMNDFDSELSNYRTDYCYIFKNSIKLNDLLINDKHPNNWFYIGKPDFLLVGLLFFAKNLLDNNELSELINNYKSKNFELNNNKNAYFLRLKEGDLLLNHERTIKDFFARIIIPVLTDYNKYLL